MSLVESMVARFRACWAPPPGASVVLLLSGGGDSTALFHLLAGSEIPFGCLHFRHDSPGAFAAQSADFCQRLCAEHGVALQVVDAAVSRFRQGGDLSWEAAARQLRYQEIARRGGLFLTAHTADDQAETLLMRLIDGSGLAGLAGIRASHGDRLARPLLEFRRQELRDFLRASNLAWVDDPSNLDGNDRARLRRDLLPFLQQEYPGLVRTLGRTARSLAADEDALSEQALLWLGRETCQGDHWPLDSLRALHPAVRYRVFREIWREACEGPRRPLGGPFRECERLVVDRDSDDRGVILPGGCRLRKLGSWLWLEPPPQPSPAELTIPGGLRQPLEWGPWTLYPPGFEAPPEGEDQLRLLLPAGVFVEGKQYGLRVRRSGDRCRGKSVKKTLAATGQPPWVRDRWPLLSLENELVAVPGLEVRTGPGEGWLLLQLGRWRGRVRKMKL